MGKCYIGSAVILALGFVAIAALIYFNVDLFGKNESNAFGSLEKKSQEIKKNLNRNVDPCNDFYEFACGNFKNNHPRGDKDTSGYFEMQAKHIEESVEALINKQVDINKQTAPEGYIREFYSKCKQSDFNNIEMLREKFNEIFGNEKANLTDIMAKLNKIGIETLISTQVLVNPHDQSQHVLTLDHPSTGSPLFGEIISSKTNNVKSNQNEKDLMFELLNEFTGPGKEQDNRENVEKIVNMTEQISFSKGSTFLRDISSFKKYTLRQLDETGFDWTGLIKKLMDKNTPGPDDIIIVSDLSYIKQLPQMIEKNKDKIIPYLKHSFIFQYSFFASDSLRDVIWKHQKSREYGVERSEWIQMNCRYFIRFHNEILGRMYISENNVSQDKVKAIEMVKEITESFRRLMKGKTWMDEETRKKALTKLDKIIHFIGYPEWLVNDTLIEKKFSYMSKDKINSQTLLDMAINLRKGFNNESFRTVEEPVDLDYEWPISTVTINAAYHILQNTITIPASMIRGIFFSRDYPSHVNYAQLGSIIGHELTHAFDSKGSMFDENGHDKNWWTEHSKTQFTQKSKCFIDQYSAIKYNVSKQNENSIVNINGVYTLGENIADNGGLREAYKAWKLRQKIEKEENKVPIKLNELDDFNEEQLFFISYANNWCRELSPHELGFRLMFDPHSPSEARVNIPLSNLKAFAKAFNCPVNSTMNTESKRCKIW